MERGQVGSKISPEKRRIKMKVIPGADSEPRLLAINDIFHGGKPVDGFVHVVAYGYRFIRNPVARIRLIHQDNLETLKAFRAYQLEEERRDLKRTCEFVRQSIKKHRTPRWMLVAATKADLYPDEIKEAESYYSPDGNSEFVELLRAFTGQVGSDNFRWAALPVCTHLTKFEWNTDTVKSAVEQAQRDAMLLNFGEALYNYSSSND